MLISLGLADVHATKDGVILLYHDSVLGRTTTGSGAIAEQTYHGGLEHVRTVEEPVQKIPTFNELCDFLMRPENSHVKANVCTALQIVCGQGTNMVFDM